MNLYAVCAFIMPYAAGANSSETSFIMDYFAEIDELIENGFDADF